MKLLFVTMHVNPAYLDAALSGGSHGIRIEVCGQGGTTGCHQKRHERTNLCKPQSFEPTPRRVSDPLRAATAVRLSTREREILQLIAEGKAAKEVAYFLKISIKTLLFIEEILSKSSG